MREAGSWELGLDEGDGQRGPHTVSGSTYWCHFPPGSAALSPPFSSILTHGDLLLGLHYFPYQLKTTGTLSSLERSIDP